MFADMDSSQATGAKCPESTIPSIACSSPLTSGRFLDSRKTLDP